MSADKINEEQQGRRRRGSRRSAAADAEIEQEAEQVEAKGITAPKGRPTPSRRRDVEEVEEKHSNLLARVRYGLQDYFEGVRSELQKVTWPTREETRRLTIVVIVALVAASIILGLISAAFTELFRIGLGNPIVLLIFMVVAVGGGLIYYRVSSRRGAIF